jgi:hypothetical protein
LAGFISLNFNLGYAIDPGRSFGSDVQFVPQVASAILYRITSAVSEAPGLAKDKTPHVPRKLRDVVMPGSKLGAQASRFSHTQILSHILHVVIR